MKTTISNSILFTLFVISSSTLYIVVNGDHDYRREHHGGVGYSFAKFSGPVSGPAHEVHMPDEHHLGHHHVDYISKPDYQFEYGVEDPKSQVSQFRKEQREDDAVVGEYSYTDPLGHVRTVKYTADKIHGFRAEIYVDGKLETPTLPQGASATEYDDESEGGGGGSNENSSHYHDSRDYSSSSSSNEDY